MNRPKDESRIGVAAALGAFAIWGAQPPFFKLMSAVPAIEIILHRTLWAIPMLAGFLLLRDGPKFWRRLRLPTRQIAWLGVSGTLVASNWLIYVWAVNAGQVLATSLGYFIGPLLNVVLGLIFFRERLTRVQTVAVLIAAAGTVFLAIQLGVPPWVSLALALTFGLYAVVRKRLGVGPMIGLLWETLLLATPALVFLAWRAQQGTQAFGQIDRSIDLLLVLAAFITILPLVWFNVAARRLSLSVIGFLQYLSPTMTFLLAVFLYDEPFTRGHAVAFGCIWAGLAAVSAESLWRARRAPRA